MVINVMDGHNSNNINIPANPHGVPGMSHHVASDGTYHHTFISLDTSDPNYLPSPPLQRPNPKAIARTRASNACNHCKARRRKCDNENGNTPCKTCVQAGEADGCYFYAKGEANHDRDARNPRVRGTTISRRSSARARRNRQAQPPQDDPWADLPPLEEMIDGVHQFFRHYFQLGFIPKERYPETLRNDPQSANVFLLLAILSVSARLSPPLKTRYGDGLTASKFFMERAQRIAEKEVYVKDALLERCQAYYVLSMAQQGEGLRKDSHMNMGIAIRLATDMELHVEESYHIPNPTPEMIIRAESSRRTVWMLHSQDKLHSGPRTVESLSASDITTLLPCDEADFAAGREPRIRAALSASPAGIEQPNLVYHPESSLFASLMEAHLFWGKCMRRGYASYARSSRCWDTSDGESHVMRKLRDWEESLPREHTFSREMLRYHKAHGQDLAYLGVTMVVRLCNIVLRRPYLTDIIHLDQKDPHEHSFYTNISLELFTNVRHLYDQIDAQFTDRAPDESVGAQMAAFCVYSCALMSIYLCKYPHICPDAAIAKDGPYMVQRTRGILVECQETWPLASCWLDAVDRFLRDPSAVPAHEGSMADSKDPIPSTLSPPRPQPRRQRRSKRRPLPSVSSEIPTPTGSHDMSSSFSGSTYSYPTPSQPHQTHQSHQPHQPHQPHQQHQPALQHTYSSPPHHHPPPPQHPQHPEAYAPSYIPHDPTLMHPHQQPPPQGMYYPRPPDGLFDTMGQAQQLGPAYEIVGAPALAAAPDGISFFAEPLVPRNDGFDDQLQTFTGATPSEMQQSNGWTNGFHPASLG